MTLTTYQVGSDMCLNPKDRDILLFNINLSGFIQTFIVTSQ